MIGGGINGVAIAREFARAGRSTLLLEQDDFGAGTTSRSTRIIHGGLRYLEHGDVGLVWESLRERKSLLKQYPNLVHPLQFLLALNDTSRRSALKIRAGLSLYRMIGGRGPGSAANQADQAKVERLLDSGTRWSVFNFQDAQCEFPERLVAEWLVEGLESGVVARNHAQVLAIDVRQGRAKGVLIRDRLSGKEERVEGAWIINATGPWADRLCRQSLIRTSRPMLSGVRGSHIVLPRFRGAPDSAVYSEGIDGRPMFVIPWNQQILVGTTEVKDGGEPGKAQASAEEIQYLLRSFSGLFPGAGFSLADIRYAFAGIRPLPYKPAEEMGSVSRKHYLHDHQADGAAQMISVIGGKLTTAAQVARECVEKVEAVSRAVSSAPRNPGLVVRDVNPLLDEFVLDVAKVGGISEDSAAGIVEWHGKRAPVIARMALSGAELRATLCPHTAHIVAEAVDAFANECAVTLGDVLLRRVPVALGACWSEECTRHVASVLKPVMSWSDKDAAREIDDFELERRAFLTRGF